MGTCLRFLGRNFVSNLDIGSGRPGRRTNEANSDVAALAYNSRLREGHISEFIFGIYAKVGSLGYFSDLSNFRVPSYGSVSSFRGGSPTKTGQTHRTLLRFKQKLRNRTVTRHTKVRKVRTIRYGPQILRTFQI